MNKETIELFNGICIKGNCSFSKLKKQKINALTIKDGFVLDPKIIASYRNIQLKQYIIPSIRKYVLSKDQLNSSFHKSWNKVKNSSFEKLFFEQIMHYVSTYGFKSMGIYSEDSIYIPNEKLNIPDVKDIKLKYIKAITKKEIDEKINDMLKSGMALNENTVNNIMTLIDELNIFIDCDKIKNKEVMCILLDKDEKMPSNTLDFLRYIIYRVTGKPMLIKSNKVLELLNKSNVDYSTLFKHYMNANNNGINLSRHFYRFKPIFMAIKTNVNASYDIKHIINRIRKQAKIYHKPMKSDYFNEITNMINNNSLNESEFKKRINDINIFRKIRLANALKYRLKDNNEILYRIRNGKAWTQKFSTNNKNKFKKIYDIVKENINAEVKSIIKNKKIYIPDNIIYTLPASEKQFVGNIPNMSYIKIEEKDLIFGIYWKNINNMQVDLDLSLMNLDGKIGWNTAYRNDNKTILFSGDITDAPNGATELFAITKQLKDWNMVMLNDFNNITYSYKMPYKLIIASEQPKNFGKNYMINPNNVITTMPMKIENKMNTIGLIESTTKCHRFYFTDFEFGTINVSMINEKTKNATKSLTNQTKSMISLNEILDDENIASNRKKADIDLTINELSKETFLNILKL